MTGSEILQQIVAERLRELDAVPVHLRAEAAHRIVAFCLGAADALMKIGSLPIGQPAALDVLYEEIEGRGLGERVSFTLKATSTVVLIPEGTQGDAKH